MELEATITRCRAERLLLREQMAEEQARIDEEDSRSKAGLQANVLSRWDQGMTSADIARALKRSPQQVERIIGKWRKEQGVKVRRGRQLPERGRVRD